MPTGPVCVQTLPAKVYSFCTVTGRLFSGLSVGNWRHLVFVSAWNVYPRASVARKILAC